MNIFKELREKTELSQSKFAKAYGIPLRTLQRWEQDQNMPPDYVVNMLKIAVETNCTARVIPADFKPLFWDTNFDQLDLVKNRDYIIIRLYTKGGMPGIRWVEKTYLPEDIINAAKQRRDLNPIVANYLSEKYGIARKEMRYYENEGNNWRKTSY